MLSSFCCENPFSRSFLYLAGLPLVLSACVTAPAPIATEPPAVIEISEVQDDVSAYSGQQIRWGGTVVGVVNNAESSDVLIVSRPLSRIHRPRASDQSSGRFIARIPEFVEPETYTEGRELTVTGTIAGTETLPIGQTEYVYPVVTVEGKHLWSKRPTGNGTYPYYHGYPHYHRPGYWWDHDHHHRGYDGVYGHFFYHGKF